MAESVDLTLVEGVGSPRGRGAPRSSDSSVPVGEPAPAGVDIRNEVGGELGLAGRLGVAHMTGDSGATWLASDG